MTADAFARLLRARRVGKGKWQAKCPAHPDHKPSLSIAEGKRGVLIRCMSAGCETRDILDALGLTFNDLFYDKATPQVRARTSIHEHRENLERQLGLVLWLEALESGMQSSRKSDANYRRFDAALSRWQSTVNGAAKFGSA